MSDNLLLSDLISLGGLLNLSSGSYLLSLSLRCSSLGSRVRGLSRSSSCSLLRLSSGDLRIEVLLSSSCCFCRLLRKGTRRGGGNLRGSLRCNSLCSGLLHIYLLSSRSSGSLRLRSRSNSCWKSFLCSSRSLRCSTEHRSHGIHRRHSWRSISLLLSKSIHDSTMSKLGHAQLTLNRSGRSNGLRGRSLSWWRLLLDRSRSDSGLLRHGLSSLRSRSLLSRSGDSFRSVGSCNSFLCGSSNLGSIHTLGNCGRGTRNEVLLLSHELRFFLFRSQISLSGSHSCSIGLFWLRDWSRRHISFSKIWCGLSRLGYSLSNRSIHSILSSE